MGFSPASIQTSGSLPNLVAIRVKVDRLKDLTKSVDI